MRGLAEAQEWFYWNEPGTDVARLYMDCLRNGIVIDRPGECVFAKRCHTNGKIVGTGKHTSNCWFVYWAKGKGVRNLMDNVKPLEYLAFIRRGALKLYKWDRVYRDGRRSAS